MKITHDSVVGGFAVFRDEFFKVAVVQTHHHQGVFKHGIAIYEPMPRSSWSIHWCSPMMPIDLVNAVMESLPKE